MLKTALLLLIGTLATAIAHGQIQVTLDKTSLQPNEPITASIQNLTSKPIHFCGVIDNASDHVGDPFFVERRSSRKWEPVGGEDAGKELSHVTVIPGQTVVAVHHPEPRGQYRLGLSYSWSTDCAQAPLGASYSHSFEVH